MFSSLDIASNKPGWSNFLGLLGRLLRVHSLSSTLFFTLKVSFSLGIVMITYLNVSHMHLSDDIKMYLKAEDYVDKITY